MLQEICLLFKNGNRWEKILIPNSQLYSIGNDAMSCENVVKSKILLCDPQRHLLVDGRHRRVHPCFVAGAAICKKSRCLQLISETPGEPEVLFWFLIYFVIEDVALFLK